jgi:hypothetical protein
MEEIVMDGEFLGKIIDAEFGLIDDYPSLMGLKLTFEFNSNSRVADNTYTINLNSDKIKLIEFKNTLKDISKILKDAKTNNVSALVGKPIKLNIESNTLKKFRILTEVL